MDEELTEPLSFKITKADLDRLEALTKANRGVKKGTFGRMTFLAGLDSIEARYLPKTSAQTTSATRKAA